jgi:hypothetical protein
VGRNIEQVEIDRIFLYEENPRHEPLQSQDEIIEHLCKDEQVFNLARSISEAGTNPLELLGVVQIEGSGQRSTKPNYEVWEGNRRLCAIKLLNDPDLAPPHLRKDIARLAEDYTPIKTLPVVVFDDHDDLKFWMAIIHGGVQEGIGRRHWDAQQKERHFGTGRNKLALAVLDLAESMGLLSKDERGGKLTTAQRHLNSPIVRDALGIDTSNPADYTYNRPPADFRAQLEKFIDDLKEGERVNSRNNRAQIDEYGRKLALNPDISGERTQPLSLKTAAKKTKKAKSKAPKKPRKLARIEFDQNLSGALGNLSSSKLESLYYSICSVSIDHVPLLTIGVWAFVESLTALAGRAPETDFVAYFSNQKLAGFGFGSGRTLAPIRDALTRIQRNGNATKHHEISASFDGKQLNNDLATITPLLLKTIETIAPKK